MKNNLESLAQVCAIIDTAYKLRANGDIRSIKALSLLLNQEDLTTHLDDDFGERLGDLIETFFQEFMDRTSRDFLEDKTIKTHNGK